MGVEPFLLASTLRGVLAQRLVRKLCPECRHPVPLTPANRQSLCALGEATPEQLWDADGCPACSRTGYAGRTGIYELITSDDGLEQLIHSGADEARIRAHAQSRGSRSLRDDGLRLVAEGQTSLEELLRVTRE
jgi:general secretion pathway protein E